MGASYISHHKRTEELPYIHYTETQIDIMQRYFEEIRALASNHTRRSAISSVTLSDNVTSHQSLCGKREGT